MFDVVIIGGGIVGLASAMSFLARKPQLNLAVLEKEAELASHQTGHNSGVIHSGLYYRPGSLKAKTCVLGARMMVEFCKEHGIPYRLCGKVVVATHPSEIPRLDNLYQRGLANGVPGLDIIGPERMKELESHATGLKAIHVPGVGILDYQAVASAMAKIIEERNGKIRLCVRVNRMERRQGQWMLDTTSGIMQTRYLISCTGLWADRLASYAGAPDDIRIVPFRGEYYDVSPSRRFLVNGMIYPVPDPALPFLGVHFTRTIDGGLHAGPNAVLALAREGYRKRDVDIADTLQLLGYGGFWKMAKRYWKAALAESYRSWNKSAFVKALQRLVPEINLKDLSPGTSGVRAQALDAAGSLLDDFEIVQQMHAILVRNVPSPAATASLCIGNTIADMAASAFNL